MIVQTFSPTAYVTFTTEQVADNVRRADRARHVVAADYWRRMLTAAKLADERDATDAYFREAADARALEML